MSLNYNEPDSATAVSDSLAANESIPTPMLNAFGTVLGLNEPGALIAVGELGAPGSAPVYPTGVSPQLMIVNTGGSAGDDINYGSIPTGDPLKQANGWVFNSDANVGITFNTTERVIQMGNGNDEVTVLGDRNTTIDGGDGNDILTLSGGADSIIGAIGNDSITAGAGADTIVSGVGIDTVDAGIGFDVLQLEGSVSDWAALADGDVVTISGAPGSGNGVEMSNVEFISFATSIEDNGQQFSIVVTDDADNKDDAMRLYQTVLDRSADQGGAQYWLDDIDAGLVNYFETAGYFLSSSEFETKYGTLTDEQFVEQMYENAFDRAAEQDGLDYWLGVLTDGGSRAEVAAYIAGSSEAATTITNVIVVTDIV